MEGKKGKEKEREELCMHKTIYAKNPSFLFRLLKQKPPNASTGCYTILNTQNIIQRVLTEYTSGVFLISTLYLMSSIRYLWTLFHVGFYNSKYKADIQDSLPPPAVFLHLSSQPHRCCLCGRSSNSNIPAAETAGTVLGVGGSRLGASPAGSVPFSGRLQPRKQVRWRVLGMRNQEEIPLSLKCLR